MISGAERKLLISGKVKGNRELISRRKENYFLISSFLLNYSINQSASNCVVCPSPQKRRKAFPIIFNVLKKMNH